MSARTLVDEAVVEERMAWARAGMGLAGHEITDPVVLVLLRGFARGELSREDAAAAVDAYIVSSAAC